MAKRIARKIKNILIGKNSGMTPSEIAIESSKAMFNTMFYN